MSVQLCFLDQTMWYVLVCSFPMRVFCMNITFQVPSNNGFALQASDVIANDYLHERAQAVQDIETHMTELGSIFERLSTMITEQGEMIDRLDDNLDAAEVNVNMGYQEIVKYGNTMQVILVEEKVV